MAQDTVQSIADQPAIEGQAGGGLMSVLNTWIATALTNGNQARAAGYSDLLAAAQEFRLRLSSLDPQADSAVNTAVTATLATI